MKRAAAVLTFLVLIPACRCGGGVNPTQLGFRSETTELDFGRVLEGDTAVKQISLTALGRADTDVAVETDPPFTVPADVTVPGGSAIMFDVEFHAGNGPVTGEVRMSANGGTAKVKLKGVGVRPKVCTPSAPCRLSTYSLELDMCVETTAADGAMCQPDSVCLEKGECHAGLCQGTARTCDDKDSCTIDSCAMDVGCIHVQRTCPAPTAPCRVATCDPVMGCGDAVASDGTPCGTMDCVNAHLCVGGGCMTVPTPEGFLCGPPTPCQGESHCHNQQCVTPEPMVMMPKTVVRLAGKPVDERPAIVTQSGNVFFQLCALPPAPDAGPVDAGKSDGGVVDAGPVIDAGPFDAGIDFGIDGGFCGLASYTGTGFERWTTRYADSQPRRLVHVSPRGVVMLEPSALELRAIPTGSPLLFGFEGQTTPRGVAQGANLELWSLVTSDGGTRLLRFLDGGELPALGLDTAASLLAVDEEGIAWAYSPDGGALGRLELDDGGWTASWSTPGPGEQSLTVAEGHIFAGLRWLVNPADGGAVSFAWLSDAGFAVDLEPRPAVTAGGGGIAFYRECINPLMSCNESDKATWMQAFSLDDGKLLWKVKVFDEGSPGTVEELSLTGYAPGAVAAIVQQTVDGGPAAFLQGFAEGKRLLNCPFPDGTRLGGAVVAGINLHTLVRRDGGAWLLETYDISTLPQLTTGWPQIEGLSGARRAR